MNHLRQFGCRRDRDAIELLLERHVLDTLQMQLLLYPSARVAQRRLKVLTDKKRVNRFRESLDLPYAYYLENRPAQAYHVVGVNWARMYLDAMKSNWLKEQAFFYAGNPIDFDYWKPDGLLVWKNTMAQAHYQTYFIEFDQSSRSNNGFDKVEKINRYYDEGKWKTEWWALPPAATGNNAPKEENMSIPAPVEGMDIREMLNMIPTAGPKGDCVSLEPKFPKVFVVTEHPQRIKLIEDKIARYNKDRKEGKIKFELRLIDAVRDIILAKYKEKESKE